MEWESAQAGAEPHGSSRSRSPQMQKLVKAAKEGTRDGLEKTKAAVKRGRSFIRTKSFISQGLWLSSPHAGGSAGGQLPHLHPQEPAHRWARVQGLGCGTPRPAILWTGKLIWLVFV